MNAEKVSVTSMNACSDFRLDIGVG